MAHVTFDTLKFVEALIVAGMPAEQAKALSEVQKRVFEEIIDGAALATKADIADLKVEIASVKSELKTEITSVKTELKTEIASVKSELKSDIAKVESEIKLMKWMLGFVFAGVGTLILKAFF